MKGNQYSSSYSFGLAAMAVAIAIVFTLVGYSAYPQLNPPKVVEFQYFAAQVVALDGGATFYGAASNYTPPNESLPNGDITLRGVVCLQERNICVPQALPWFSFANKYLIYFGCWRSVTTTEGYTIPDKC